MNIIPRPVMVDVRSSEVGVPNPLCTFAPNLPPFLLQYFSNIFEREAGIALKLDVMQSKGFQFHLIRDDELSGGGEKKLDLEGYHLSITQEGITVKAKSETGVFYGLQSLRQLFPKSPLPSEVLHLPQVEITDYPRFMWRGFMLDVGRHYRPVEEIKKILDIMAMLKMNKFHWHLTEDQGWRIEIKKYPRLTEVGSKRKDTKIGGWMSKKYRGQPHKGFYTQEEIRDLVAYARERYIEVIPEIDIPGHSTAAVAAYPELSCKEQPVDVDGTFGILKNIYCPGKESTFEILQNILEEVIGLFPSEVIHIGGDEVPKDPWKACEKCQQRIVENNLADEKGLQVYFNNRIVEFLKARNRRLMGWNEILHPTLDSSAIAQKWTPGGGKTVLNHLRSGRQFVMSRMGFVYLDYNYVFTPLRKTYQFEPVPKGLEPHYHCNVLGIETPLWTEWVPNLKRLGWQLFPRLFAVAETGWTPRAKKDFDDFWTRLGNQIHVLDNYEMPYAPLEDVNPSNWERLKRISTILKWPEI